MKYNDFLNAYNALSVMHNLCYAIALELKKPEYHDIVAKHGTFVTPQFYDVRTLAFMLANIHHESLGVFEGREKGSLKYILSSIPGIKVSYLGYGGNNMDPTYQGDAWIFRGGGLLQTTGRRRYEYIYALSQQLLKNEDNDLLNYIKSEYFINSLSYLPSLRSLTGDKQGVTNRARLELLNLHPQETTPIRSSKLIPHSLTGWILHSTLVWYGLAPWKTTRRSGLKKLNGSLVHLTKRSATADAFESYMLLDKKKFDILF